MKIGEAARAAGVTPRMIRHYEHLGLLPPPERRDSGYREYGRADLERLRFIASARALGFGLEAVGALLSLKADPGRASREVRQFARDHIRLLEEQAERIAAMRASLQSLVARCPGDEGADCPIIEALAGTA